jgi:hypothetical protein
MRVLQQPRFKGERQRRARTRTRKVSSTSGEAQAPSTFVARVDGERRAGCGPVSLWFGAKFGRTARDALQGTCGRKKPDRREHHKKLLA